MERLVLIERLERAIFAAIERNQKSATSWITHAAEAVVEVIEPQLKDIERWQREMVLVHGDIKELCQLTGEFDGARPESPHIVFQKCLNALRKQHEASSAAREMLIHAMPPIHEGKYPPSGTCAFSGVTQP